jgi:outer membrane protein insertion porin family
MDAKQTLSASLVGLLCAVSPALGDDAEQPPGEVQPKQPESLKMRRPTGTFEVGAGYSTDDGFVAGVRIAQPELFGSDKGLMLGATISERWREMILRYDDPTLFGTDLRLRGDLYSRAKHYTGFTRESNGGELTLTKRIAPNFDAFVGYRLEHVAIVGDDDVAARGMAIPTHSDYVLGALRAGVEYSTIGTEEQRYYPRHGTVAGAAVTYADEQLGSEVSYLRMDTWLAHHQPLGPFTLHLGARSSTIATSLTEGIPISERLHFDGSSDVRGFAPGSILPGGGTSMWSARAELETPSWQGLSVAGFFDAGGLYGDGAGGEAASAGFGIIWRSPIGPLRFDWAKPLTGEDRDLRFVFGIGGMF